MICSGKTMKKLGFLFGLALLSLSGVALAQMRMFPPDAPRGYLKYDKAAKKLVLNNKAINPAPGLQIRDQANRIIVPQMLLKEEVVKYKLEGPNLHRAWVMTLFEIKQPDKHKLPTQALPADKDGQEEDDDEPPPSNTPTPDEDD